MNDCVFCKMIKGEIPSYKVYEDKTVVAFLDINPVHEGHVLVLPKKHVVNLEDVSEKLLNKTIKIVKKFGQSIKDNLAPGYNIIVNNDPVAGQEIQHLHFHVIPRYDKDRLTTWTRNQYGEGRVELIQKQLKIN